MSPAAQDIARTDAAHPLCAAFLKWQCRVRQMAMRDAGGRPDDAIMPVVTISREARPLGRIVTLLCKNADNAHLSEIRHIARQTHDPAQRRTQAIRNFSATHYLKPQEFSDILTAAFVPHALTASKILAAERCTLAFDAYSQKFALQCRVRRCDKAGALYQATWWHNFLFNPSFDADAEILGFEPDWEASDAEPLPV